MKLMKYGMLAALLICLSAAAQDVHYNYDRQADFSSYRTYRWETIRGGAVEDQITDQNIRQIVDDEMASKGFRKVETNPDLLVGYQAALGREKQLNGWGAGPRFGGMGTVTTSTITTGKLVVDLYDPARKQLVWRGDVEKALNPSKDPDKNYKRLQSALAKLFKNYPPKEKK